MAQALKKQRRKPKRPALALPACDSVLAFDISSRCVGWSLFTHGQLEIASKILLTGNDQGHGHRLAAFHDAATALFEQYKPEHVIYEAPYQGHNRYAFGVLIRYVGALEAAFARYFDEELPLTSAVPAHMVKRTIGMKRGKNHEENKRLMLLKINQVFGLALKFKANDRNKVVSEDDIADAIALNFAWHLLRAG